MLSNGRCHLSQRCFFPITTIFTLPSPFFPDRCLYDAANLYCSDLSLSSLSQHRHFSGFLLPVALFFLCQSTAIIVGCRHVAVGQSQEQALGRSVDNAVRNSLGVRRVLVDDHVVGTRRETRQKLAEGIESLPGVHRELAEGIRGLSGVCRKLAEGIGSLLGVHRELAEGDRELARMALGIHRKKTKRLIRSHWGLSKSLPGVRRVLLDLMVTMIVIN
ncbi:hypothetical protein GW17_00061569 [Ensete ventricosum]|nr:hypothetical protein GW17_00061569 [Ensete ventricosum]